MVSRSYESIISKVTAYVCLDNFPADSITGNKILVLTLRASFISKASSHFVQGKGPVLRYYKPRDPNGHQEIQGIRRL